MMELEALPLWAKLQRNEEGAVTSWHSLYDHSCDVAAVMESLLRNPVFRKRFSVLAGRLLDEVDIARLSALAFLHDIGKVNRGFRQRWKKGVRGAGHIGPLAGLIYSNSDATLGGKFLSAIKYESWAGWLDGTAAPLFDAVYAHHGSPWQVESEMMVRALWVPGTDMDPIADAEVIGKALPVLFPEAFAEEHTGLPGAPEFQHAFAGLLMLADWLGSDSDPNFFPFSCGEREGTRMDFSRERSPRILSKVGLAVEPVRIKTSSVEPDFRGLFSVEAPRPAQIAVTGPRSRCLILESETGSGKTEAALWRFYHLFREGLVDGMYFALPTRVAATQAFERIQRFANAAFGKDRPAVVLAVPGQAMADGVKGHPLPDFNFAWDDDPDDVLRQSRWAAEHPKRFLAAHIAVGTIDQVLLSAIQVKHSHLRGTSLLRHLLVVDEVHASDRFMEQLLSRVLRDHERAGGHALLLSATLGSEMRSRLLGTVGPSLAEARRVPYPALAWADQKQERHLAILQPESEQGKSVRLTVQSDMGFPDAVAETALRAARAGAKVLVIRNSVAGAIDVQVALESLNESNEYLFRTSGIPSLHHGRYAPSDRRLLDRSVVSRMGKDRPDGGLIVIGTQTLEVSLDLDADLLLTDLCPIDVLLQRMGRLHRHSWRKRPPGFETPRAVILVPKKRNLLPFTSQSRHGIGGQVYDDLRIIETTWRLIETSETWQIPGENRELVEMATHPDRLEFVFLEMRATAPKEWQAWLNKVEGSWQAQKTEAVYGLLDRTIPFDRFNATGFREEGLATRLGAKDQTVNFDPPLSSPFGERLSTIRLPSWMVKGDFEDQKPENLTVDGGQITFDFAGKTLCYDRLGLRFAD